MDKGGSGERRECLPAKPMPCFLPQFLRYQSQCKLSIWGGGDEFSNTPNINFDLKEKVAGVAEKWVQT